ncbi:MAG: hypothetical protein WDN72_06055 [Alphaproteobacteria bacterium]
MGMMKGAHTFGQIGSLAAISAESAEMGERRRYLLDRYYALPNDRAYDAEAEQIQRMLTSQHDAPRPTSMFHWKTVLLCAALGAIVCTGFALLPATAPAIGTLFSNTILGELVASLPGGLATISGAIGVAAGTLTGAVIGLDRHYVRTWFDKTETFVSDPDGNRVEMMARERELRKLEEVSPDRDRSMQSIKLEVRNPEQAGGTVSVTGNPGTRVDNVHLETALAERIQRPSV